jgi:hypothetical protein
MTTISQANLVKLFQAQGRSADLWCGEWERHKDVGALRNAAMAIGKVQGIYNVICFMIQGDENLPDEIIQAMQKYLAVWDSLHLPERA